MSFRTASAILRGIFLIEPEYAKSQVPLLVDLIKGTASNRNAESHFAFQKENPLPKKVAAAGAIAGTSVYKIYPFQSTDRLPYDSIAIVDITGPILKYGDWCGYGSLDYSDLIVRLANSERITGIILNIDSPGGQAAGTAMLFNTIRQATLKKPVLAYIQDGYAASAAYWVASAAQEIFVSIATDQVGSIGAYQTIYDFAGRFEQAGIKVHEIYAPQSVDKNKTYKDAIAGDATGIQADLKVLVNNFISGIKSSRGARINQAGDEPFTGKMYFAAEAKSRGLIDGVKTFEGVVARMNQLINLRK